MLGAGLLMLADSGILSLLNRGFKSHLIQSHTTQAMSLEVDIDEDLCEKFTIQGEYLD